MWPVGIVAVLVVTVGANLLMMAVANDPNANAVEPDYYRKAVRWDSTMVQRERNRELGWVAEARLAPIGRDGNAQVTVVLRDAGGAGVAGARVEVTAIHNSAADHRPHAVLETREPGVYGGALMLRRFGLWELRIVAERDGETYTTSLRHDVALEQP